VAAVLLIPLRGMTLVVELPHGAGTPVPVALLVLCLGLLPPSA